MYSHPREGVFDALVNDPEQSEGEFTNHQSRTRALPTRGRRPREEESVVLGSNRIPSEGGYQGV